MTVRSMLKSLIVLTTLPAILLTLSACSEPNPPATSTVAEQAQVDLLQQVVDSEARSEQNKARDLYRRPYETLSFFDVQPTMTVVEISPGGGWYTEILAPYLKDLGTLYAAHFPANSQPDSFYARSRAAFLERVATDANFENVIVTEFSPTGEQAIAPAASADLVLTFRNLHNWYMSGGDEAVQSAFRQFYEALKPGGVLGVVDHRLPEARPDEDMASTGYMKQSYAIAMAEAAGFELSVISELNANAQDTADHPRGVWTLPPTLRLGDENRETYLAIGESDRFTLKFVKPTK